MLRDMWNTPELGGRLALIGAFLAILGFVMVLIAAVAALLS